MKKIAIFPVILTALILTLVAFACASTPQVQYVLAALTPPPKTPEPEKNVPTPPPTPTPSPKIVIAKVVRVVGNPKATDVYLNVGFSTRGIVVGRSGTLYNDPGLTQRIGEVKLTNVQKDVSEAKVIEVTNKIDKVNARVRFEIPQ